MVVDVNQPAFADRPRPAPVAPRVRAPGGEPLPLEHYVGRFVAARACGAINLFGPAGSGKTYALRHLAAILPPQAHVYLLDDPLPEDVRLKSRSHLVVFTSVLADRGANLASLELQPWANDDLIEYLLARQPARCASVMSRLKGARGAADLCGLPDLWRFVLEEMASNEDATEPAEVLLKIVAREVGQHELLPIAAGCLQGMLRDIVEDLLVPASVPPLAAQLLRHRPLQLMLAADALARRTEGGFAAADLEARLPDELIDQTARRVRQSGSAPGALEALIEDGELSIQPMAVSILVCARPKWRPPGRLLRNLVGAKLSGVAWAAADLAGCDLRQAELPGADLRAARLLNADLREANLSGAKLSRASLEGIHAGKANFAGADLCHADVRRADFPAADLTGANLAGAVLAGADLEDADLSGARCAGADFSKASLRSTIVGDADFTGAAFAGATLAHVDLGEAHLSGACFARARLRDCNLERITAAGVDFSEADLSGCLLTGSGLCGADLHGARLRHTGLAEIEWEGVNLRDADLRGATFHLGSSRSGLVGSPIPCEGSKTGFYTDDYSDQDYKPPEDIRKANLRGADLRGARLDDVDFYLVDLRHAKYTQDQEEYFAYCGAILRG